MDRIVLALLFEGLHEEQINDTDSRIVLNIKPSLAPIKVNVLPLIKNVVKNEIPQRDNRGIIAIYNRSTQILFYDYPMYKPHNDFRVCNPHIL